MTSAPLDWRPFAADNAIGDPGRQPEIRAVHGPLDVGVSDTALDFLSLDAFELRGCATRGWSHRYKGTPRQDAYSLLVNDEVIVIAVADGVSQGEYSQVAADTAARSACKLVADQLSRTGTLDWDQISGRVSKRIIEEAEYRQISHPEGDQPTIDERLRACLSTMATTLIVAVVQRAATHEGHHVEIGVVAGDSVAYLHPAGRDVLVSVSGGKTGTGPITSSRVRPLPGAVEPEVSTFFMLPGEALILGSDGIGDPIGDGDGEVGRELASRWAEPPAIDDFLRDVNVYRRSFDDDRTAVGLWLRPDITLPEAPEPEPEIEEPVADEETVDPTDEAVADEEAVDPIDEPDPDLEKPETQLIRVTPAEDDLTLLADAVLSPEPAPSHTPLVVSDHTPTVPEVEDDLAPLDPKDV